MRILIIEDARVMALSLRRQLLGIGYADTTVATSAEDAIECLKTGTFDLILLDWVLPGMSGLELLRMLRGTRRYAQVPIVMTTSNDDRRDVIEAFEAGVTDYVVKPYDIAKIGEKLDAIRARFGRRGLPPDAAVAGGP